MSRPTALLATAAILLTAAPAAAGPSNPQRRVSAAYTSSGVDQVVPAVPAFYVSGGSALGETHAVTVGSRVGERTVTVSLADATGRPALAAVTQVRADGVEVELGRVCSGEEQVWRLPAPGRPVTAYLLAGQCPNGPSVPVTGEVRFTFSAR